MSITPTNNNNNKSSCDKPKTQQLLSSLKGQIISFDRYDENENNFSFISSGIMRIMQEMLNILPDSMVNEVLNLLKFESFIMFAMVKH